MQGICKFDYTTEKGLTLIEVMIALSIFTIGILAVAGMQGVSMKTIGNAHRQTHQSVSAANLIEKILTQPYDDPLLKDRDNGYEPGVPDHGPYPMNGSPATIEWEVQDDFPVNGTKRITVTVRPIARGGTASLSPSTFQYVRASEQRANP